MHSLARWEAPFKPIGGLPFIRRYEDFKASESFVVLALGLNWVHGRFVSIASW